MNPNVHLPSSSKNQEALMALRSLDRFVTFYEEFHLPMMIYSVSEKNISTNKEWRRLLPSSLSCIESFIQRAHTEEAFEQEAFWYEGHWLEAHFSHLKNELGVVDEILITLKDVSQKIETQNALIKTMSDRQALDEKLKLTEGRLYMAVKAGKIGIWEWIPDTNHVSIDATTEEIFGFLPNEFNKSSEVFNQILHPEDRDHYWTTISHSINEKKSYRIELRIMKKDGSLRWIQASGMPILDGNQSAILMLGTVLDITERVESEADQKFLSEASELLIGCLDHKEILKTISEHATNYFCDGVLVDQLLTEGDIKRLMVIHKSPALVKQFMAMDEKFPNRYDDNPLLDTLITGKPLFIEDAAIFWQKKNSQLDAHYILEIDKLGVKSSIRARLKGRESILGMITFFILKDSKKTLNRRHIWLAEELAYRASMAVENALIHQASQEAIRSRDEFLSIASHELKTPLQSLTLQNQMRKRNLDKKLLDVFVPEKLGGMIEADLKQLLRINRLIDDMLDISRIRAGKLTFLKEKVEYCSFVKDVVERFRPQLEAVGCYFSATYCEAVFTDIDIYRIEQVIVNLLTNAMKYGAGKPIKLEVTRKQNRLFLMVHDKGLGIREQDLERIFERFERAISSSEVSGLGLGLYISRQIMEQNKGSLTARSDVGVGSTFIMELPCEH